MNFKIQFQFYLILYINHYQIIKKILNKSCSNKINKNIMHRRTAYLNSPIKKIQLDLIKNHHKQNLENMRAMNKSSIDFQFIPINKTKGQFIEDEKYFQIQKQNDILIKKINQIMNSKDKTKYHHSPKKASKSLNQIVKKQFQNKLDQENDKMKRRLQLLKSTYQTSKIMKHWVENKNFAKNVSKFNFNIIDTPAFNQTKNRSFYIRSDSKISIERIKQIDGLKFKLKIMENSDKLRIVGDLQNGSDLRIIDIPKQDADILIKKHCFGKKQNLLRLLHYDAKTEELLLSVEDIKLQQDQKQLNPEKISLKNKKKTSAQKRKHILPEDLIIKNGNVSLPQIKKEKKDIKIKNPKLEKTKIDSIKVQKQAQATQLKQNKDTLIKQNQQSHKKIEEIKKKTQIVIKSNQQTNQQIAQNQEKNYEEQFQEQNKVNQNEINNSQKIQKIQIAKQQNIECQKQQKIKQQELKSQSKQQFQQVKEMPKQILEEKKQQEIQEENKVTEKANEKIEQKQQVVLNIEPN